MMSMEEVQRVIASLKAKGVNVTEEQVRKNYEKSELGETKSTEAQTVSATATTSEKPKESLLDLMRKRSKKLFAASEGLDE